MVYSLTIRFQYISDKLPATFHLCQLSISFSFISTTPCTFKDCLDITWFGVNTVKLSLSSLIDVKGQLLIVPSIGTRVVINWSSRIGRLFDTDFNTFFAIFTNDSQAPPIHGLLGHMKWHWIFQIDKLFVIVVLSKIFSNNFNSRFAPTKFWLFSLHILLGLPHLDVSLCNTVIKQSVLKSPANSKGIALYVRHVKTTPYLLSVPVLALVCFTLFMVIVIGLK